MVNPGMIPHEALSTLGLLLSGGLDSSILLGHLAGQGHRVCPLYIRSGLVWECDELRSVRRYLSALSSPAIGDLAILDLPLADVYGKHWSITGRGTPDAASPDEAVYLPGRNPLLLVKAAIWCHLHQLDCLALGTLGSNPFADATDEFFDAYEAALNRALGGRLRILRPFAGLSKRQVMELGRGLPLAWTFSCISPLEGRHCGACNKCAERRAAFTLIGMNDPTHYAAKASIGQ
jgi:7-cyano-7-deazaguanine synthase